MILKRYFLTGKEINFMAPTICCMRRNLRKSKANQIMFRLNPNKDWVINSKVLKVS